MFSTTRFCYIKVLFLIFYYYWGEEYRSLYRVLRYIEVRFIEVLLYKEKSLDITKPRHSEDILPVPLSFVISRFHCYRVVPFFPCWTSYLDGVACFNDDKIYGGRRICRGSFMHSEVVVGDSKDHEQPLTLQVWFGNGDDY